MYAENLERILFFRCEHSDVSHSLPDEYVERFKSLLCSALLPCGRERCEEELSNKEIANAVFGLVSSATVCLNSGMYLLTLPSGTRPAIGTQLSP
jgi:hypothetical protein